MAAVTTTSFDFDEELRKAQEAARKAEEEAARAQKEAEEQTRRAQEETERATQEAEQAAADAEKQAQSAQPDVPPEAQETTVPMEEAQAQPMDQNAMFLQDIQGTVNDTRFKVSRYDEVNGYYQGMADDELKGKIVSHASGTPIETGIGNDVYIDYGSIKSKEQAYMVVMLGTDDKAKAAIAAQCAKKLGMRQDVFDAQCENYVYDRYGRQVYSTPKSDAGKNRFYTQGMSAIGLMDTNGNALDMTLATPQDIMHACRMEPDESMADTAYALAQYGSKVPGNMWYGMNVTKDMFTFVDSAELTKKDYDAEVSAFDQSFSYSDMDGNKAAYLDNYQYLLNTYGGNQRVFNSMLSALNKSFNKHTNLEAPDEETVKQALAQAAQAVSAEEPAGEEEQKKRWWNALGDWVKTNLLDLPSAEGRRETERRTIDEIKAELEAMEAQENAPEQDGTQGTQSSGASSVISAGGVTSVGGQDVSFRAPVASAAVTSGVQTNAEAQDVPQMQPPSGAYKKSEVQGPVEAAGVRMEKAAYDPNMTDVQALMLHQQGYVLDPRNQAQIETYMKPEVRAVLTNERGRTGSGFEISEGGAAWPVAEVTGRRKYGPELGEVIGLLGSTSLEGEALALAQLQTMDIAYRLQEYAAAPYTPERPQGVNAYTWGLSQNPEIAADLSALKKQLISGNSMHGELVAENAQEIDARMQGYVQAALAGSATPEMLASLSEYYAGDVWDVESDESRNKMVQRLYGNGALFARDSDFWDGDSLAAAEGRNILTAGGMQGFLDFCDDMTQCTQDILDSYTAAANRIGMTLEDYLGSAGITDIRQIADIAYNEIRAQGAAILDSPELIAEVDAQAQHPVGLSDVICGNYELSGWEATKLGAGIGVSEYFEGFCQTSYMVLDAATYTQTRQRLMDEWYGQYGELAPQMYRRAINLVLAGDSLSEEMKTELSRNMDGADNIFDLAYEIDPGMLKGVFRYGRAELGKEAEKLQSVKDRLTPEQQAYVDIVAGGANSLTGMAVNAAAAGAGAVIGAPALVARTAGALLGTGFNAFEDAYDENFHARGMDREHAAAAAFGDAVFMTATEYLTPDLATDLLFGGQTQQAMVKAARKSPVSFFQTMAKTTFARALDEGKEEMIQTLGGHVFNILDDLYIADQNGQKVTPSLAMKTVLSGFANTDWGDLTKETALSGLGGLGYGLVFGIAGTAAGMLPGGATRAALADGKAFRSYESVQLACGIAEGSVEASTENLSRLYTLLGSDLQDPKFCMTIDRTSQQAATSRQVMTAMLEGEAADALERAADHADKARAYGDKADAAKAAVSQSQEDYMALRETVSGGDLDKVPALEAAQQRWAKAQTAYNEASEAYGKERDKAGRSAKEWLDACMAKAQTYTAEGMRVQMNRIAALRDGMARRLDALYTQMEQERGTYEAELARSADLEALEMTDEEIDASIGEMEDVDSRAQQAQEMGLDEDTVSAIREQGSTDESRARREAIIRNQRNAYASLQARMQTAQELSDTDAYDQLKARQDGIAQRLERLGVQAVDPDAEAKSRQAASRERIRDVATGTTAQQREAERVMQQEAANIREMDADAYIEQNHPDASEEDKAKLRELYARIFGEQTDAAQDEPASMTTQDGMAEQPAQEKTGGAAEGTDGLRMMARLGSLYGFRTEVVEDDDPRLKGADGGYDPETNTMVIPRSMTQSQALKRTLVHELTHFSERGGKAYEAYQKALLALRYEGNTDKQQADVSSIMRRYNEHYRRNNQLDANGNLRTMDDAGARSELTARITAEIVSGNQDMIERLTAREPGIARRIANTIRDFIARLRGVKGEGVDQLERVERMFRRALKKAQKAGKNAGGMQYALVGRDADGKPIYESNYGPDTPRSVKVNHFIDLWQNVWSKSPIELEVLGENGESRTITASFDPDYDPDNQRMTDLGKVIHNKNGSSGDRTITLNLADDLHDMARDVKHVESETERGKLSQTHADVKEWHYFSNDFVYRDSDGDKPMTLWLDLKERDDGGWVYQMYAKKTKKKADVADPRTVAGGRSATTPSPNTSVAQTDTGVNPYSMENGMKYALPSDDVLEQEIRDWMAGREAQLQEAMNNDGVSRFASGTVQRIEAVPVRVRQEFDTNPILRSYKTDSNADQMRRATDRIERAGYQSEVDRLLEAESFNADDNVEAGMIALAAFENGDIRTGLDMALKYRIAGTEQGKALQSRKVLSKMTPTHMALKISADMEKRLADTAKALPEKAKDVNRRAADAQKALDGLSTADETQRILSEGGTIDRSNNVQGAVVNEQQRAAIRHYGLEHTDRKIDHYNRATLKQRMLEFILDTPDLSADTGNGVTGYQRLEWMKEGKAVMTSTDLRHIMSWATAYGRLSDEEQAGRMGDILMGRIAEAYANMTPATSFEKARTSRFVNMLMSLTSSQRNTLGNGLQNAVNAVTHDTMEVGLDKLVSLATGKRTKAELTFAERAEGWRAFVDETVNTFHDYFVDEVDTTPRDQDTDRFDSAKRGRVYQGELMHGAQQLEGFLMSFGDRHFYKRAYVNSINEQMRVAEMNGLEPDMDAILLQAKQDADYATFNEDGELRRWLSKGQRIPVIGQIFSLYCPFVGVPTNIARRGFVEYSPLGALITVGQALYDAAQGSGFNQRRFVEGMARSVTGSTMLLGMGYLMAANGMYFPGTGDEEDQNVAALRAAEGQQYSPFIRIGDTYVSLGAFAPAIYPVTIGATVYNTLKKSDGDRKEAIKNAMIAISNQFFDSTFMSGLTEVFNTQNSTVPENIIATLPKTAANQMVPFGALLSQVATGLDTYARDTKDASVILRAMKDAAARIPFLREQVLDVKTDITGRPVESKPGLANNLLNPLTTTQAVDDPALAELDRLYDALGTSAHIPSTLIKTSGKVTILAAVADNRRVAMDRKNGEHNLVLTASQRNQYNRMYAGLCFDGTGDGDYVRLQGIDTRFTGIRDLMETPAYKRAGDKERAEMISEIIKKAKQLTHAQMVYDLGYMK